MKKIEKKNMHFTIFMMRLMCDGNIISARISSIQPFPILLQWMHPIHIRRTGVACSRAQVTTAATAAGSSKHKCHFILNISIYFYALILFIRAQTRSEQSSWKGNNNFTSSSGHHTSASLTLAHRWRCVSATRRVKINWTVFYYLAIWKCL